MAYQFSFQGSNPTPTVQNAGLYSKSTPKGNALNSATQPDWLKTLNSVQSATKSMPISQNAGLGQSVAPTTPVKKQTNVDGSSVEYHAPAKTSSTSPTSNADGSFTDSNGTFHSASSVEAQNNKNINSQGVDARTPSQNQTYSNANVPTYAGMIGAGANLSTNAATTGSTNYNQANTGLINSLAENQRLSQRAQEIATQAGQKISDIGGQGARGEVGYLTTGTSPVGEGNAAVVAQTTAAQQQAVAQGAQQALEGTQQGLTAQNQTQTGYNNALTGGLTGQGQGITGLGTNAGLLQPQPYAPGTTPYNPANGQYGQMAGSNSGGLFGVGQTLNQQSLGTQYSTNNTQISAANNLISQLGDLVGTGTINPSNINAANNALALIAQNTSNPQYALLRSQLNNIGSAYAKITGNQFDVDQFISMNKNNLVGAMQTLGENAKAVNEGLKTGSGGSNSYTSSSGKSYNLPY